MIIYNAGNRNSMVRINPINPNYQNNRNWAIANKKKGRHATLCAIGSTAIGCMKTVTEKDSLTNRVLDCGQKVLDGLRNLEQYSLYKREDDDLDFDKRQRPIAGNVGQLACGYETKVNPVAVPLSAIVGGKFGESYNIISNWLCLLETLSALVHAISSFGEDSAMRPCRSNLISTNGLDASNLYNILPSSDVNVARSVSLSVKRQVALPRSDAT